MSHLDSNRSPVVWWRGLLPLLALLVLGCDSVLVDPNMVRTYTEVSAGGEHSCALGDDGSAYCWGRGLNGELGDGAVRSQSLPTRVKGWERLASISAGAAHSCALSEEGKIYCWGWNAAGQLGLGSRVGYGDPVEIPLDLEFTAVSAGLYHSCGLSVEGTVYCWGLNTHGQLGTGDRAETDLPTDRKSTRLNSSHVAISYAVFCLKKNR